MPMGRGRGGHGRRKKILLSPHPHALNSTASTNGHFVLSPVSLATRLQDGDPVELLHEPFTRTLKRIPNAHLLQKKAIRKK